MVALYIGSSRFCGGFLVSQRDVVTAASCVQSVSMATITAYVGISRLSQTAGGQIFNITRVQIHPDFMSTAAGNDIAVLRLGGNVTLSSNAALCCYGNDSSVPTLNEHAVVIGWGEISLVSSRSDTLRQAIVRVTSASSCGLSSDASRFCAGYGSVSTCPSDIGGPLMTSTNNRWTCSGIVTGNINTCYRSGTYTRVGYYYDFINQ